MRNIINKIYVWITYGIDTLTNEMIYGFLKTIEIMLKLHQNYSKFSIILKKMKKNV